MENEEKLFALLLGLCLKVNIFMGKTKKKFGCSSNIISYKPGLNVQLRQSNIVGKFLQILFQKIQNKLFIVEVCFWKSDKSSTINNLENANKQLKRDLIEIQQNYLYKFMGVYFYRRIKHSHLNMTTGRRILNHVRSVYCSFVVNMFSKWKIPVHHNWAWRNRPFCDRL